MRFGSATKTALEATAALAFSCALGPSAAGGEQEQRGELTFSSSPYSMGVVARRVFRDGNGRTVKKVIYVLNNDHLLSEPPYTEEMLAVAEIRAYKYDGHGREMRTEYYTADMTLMRSHETSYDVQGRRKAVVGRDSRGIRTSETRYSDGRQRCGLFYDRSGVRLVAVTGSIPNDVDLAYGWGKVVDGLSCGIVPSPASAPLRKIRIYVTVRNHTLSKAKVVTVWAAQYRVIRMGLRDSKGALVPQTTEYVDKREKELLRMKRGPSESLQTLYAGKAAWYTAYSLNEWYADLAPGRYHLTLRRRGSGEEFSLISNTVPITVNPEKPRAPEGSASSSLLR